MLHNHPSYISAEAATSIAKKQVRLGLSNQVLQLCVREDLLYNVVNHLPKEGSSSKKSEIWLEHEAWDCDCDWVGCHDGSDPVLTEFEGDDSKKSSSSP